MVNDTPTILGPDGKPARRREPEMGAYDSVFATAYKFAPYNPDALISAKGFQILRDQLRQTSVSTPLNIVRTAVLAKPWGVMPCVQDEANDDYPAAKQIADALDYDLRHIGRPGKKPQDFRHACWELASAIHYGFRVTEIDWQINPDGPNKGKMGVAGFYAKPCKQIGFDLNLKTLDIEHITSYTPREGYQFDIDVERTLIYTFQPEDGLPYGTPIGAAAYKHSWSIDNLYRFWNICLEVFGTPFILAKAPEAAKAAAAKALSAIRMGGVAVLPPNVEAELMEVAEGGASGFMQAVDHHIRQIAYAYEHSVLTSGEGQHGATSAGSDVHQDTSDYQHCFVRTDLENIWNLQFIPRWMRYNYGPEAMRLSPRISLGEWDATDMANMANAFSTYISSGVLHPSEPQIREKAKLKPITPDAKKAMDDDKAHDRSLKERQISAKEQRGAKGKDSND